MGKARAHARILEAMLLLIAAGVLALSLTVHHVKTDEAIYINGDGSIFLGSSSNNVVLHNRFLSNVLNARCTGGSVNTRDNGYPSGCIYRSGYTSTNAHHYGTGDTRYTIDGNNDNNPPMISQTLYDVTFYVSGVNSDFTGTVITIDSVNYAFSDFPVSFSWDSASVHNFSYASPLSASVGKQYVWDSTTGLSTLQTDSITITQSGSVTANYKTQYELTVSSAYDSPSPSSGWFDSGSSITESVTSPIPGPTDVQYVCTGWTGTGSVPTSGSDSSLTFTITEPSSITWDWKTQYQLTLGETGVGLSYTGTVLSVDSVNYGLSGLPVLFWWDSGSGHSFAFASPLVAGSVQYVWSSTSGLSTLQSGSLSVSSSGSVVGNYVVQNQVTFDQVGVSADFASTVIIIDSVSYSRSQLPVSFSWGVGSTHSFAFQSPLVVGASSKQYAWTSTTGLSSLQSGSITVSNYGSIIGNYKTQYYLTVTSAYDSPSPSSGWFDSGTSVTESVTSPFSSSPGTQYACTGWTGTGSTPASGIASSVTFTISAPSTITWNWKTQYYLTVTSAYDSPYPSSGWFDSGSSVAESVTSPVSAAPGKRYVCTGWSGTGNVPTSGTALSVGFVITRPSSITWNWKTQYYLTVTSAYDSPSQISSWLDAGSIVTESVSSPVSGGEGIQYACTGWSGTGNVPSSGSSTSTTFTINTASSITWNWQTQYLLIVSTNAGTTSPSGMNWYDAGSNATVSASSPSPIAGEWYIWNGWTGSGTWSFTGSTSSPTLTMNGPINETASWTHQYYLTVSSAYGTPTPSSEWVDAGTQVTETLAGSPSTGPTGTQYVCTGWSGTGSVESSGSSLSTAFTVNAPSTITWNWKTQYQLTVTSAYDSPTGEGWYDSDSIAHARLANATVSGTGGVEYVFTGWSGDASGTDYAQSDGITMDGPKTATAEWTTAKFALIVMSPYGSIGGSTNPPAGAYPQNDSSQVTVTATPDTGYTFAYWVLDDQNITDNPIDVTMTADHTIMPVFQPLNFTLTILPSDNGATDPAAGAYSYSYGTNVTINASPSTGNTFDHWLLDGATVTSNPITISVNGNHALQPFFQTITPTPSPTPTPPPESSQLTMVLYVLACVAAVAVAVFALFVFIRRRT